MIKFTIFVEPVAQGRPRASLGRYGINMRDPEKSRIYKDLLWWEAQKYKPAKPLEGPLSMCCIVYRSIPTRWSKKKKQLAEEGKILPVTKPDVDNYLKGIKDAFNKLLYKDDSQIVRYHGDTGKYYSFRPRIEIEIKEIICE